MTRVWMLRIALALVGGALLVLAFPPYGMWWLAPFCVAANLVAVRNTRWWQALLLGFGQGMVFYLVLLTFVQVVGYDGWIILAAWCALWMGLMSVVIMLVERLPGWPVWVACAWVLQEALRDRVPFGGFSWGRLAYAATDAPITSLASLLGAPFLTFMLALFGALGVWVIVSSGRRMWIHAAAGVVVIAGLITAGSLWPTPAQAENGSPVIAVIQGNTAGSGMDAFDQTRVVLDNHVAETERLAARVARGEVEQPQLVIWPENASDLDPFLDPTVANEIAQAALAVKAPILVGAVITYPGDPTHVANVGIVWDPVTGPGEIYIKRHPLPFGEFVPFRPLLERLISRFEQVPRDFQAGTEPGVLDAGGVVLGDVICYEVAFDDIVHDAIADGGQVLVVQTNNATYMGTYQPEQQWAITRLRAVEHGRTALVAATSGISGWISADGTIVEQLPEERPGTIVGRVPMRTTINLTDRLGWWPEFLASFAAVAAVVAAVVIARRRPQPPQLGSCACGAEEGCKL